MNSIKFVIQNPEGTVVEEQTLKIANGDTLVMQFKEVRQFRHYMSLPEEDRKKVADNFKKAVEGDGGVLVLPPGIELQVIHKVTPQVFDLSNLDGE